MGDSRYRVAVIGLVHDHVWWELDKWAACARAELVAVADPHQALREKACREYDIPAQFEDWQQMLDALAPQVVQLCVPNNEGAPIVEALAARGIHIASEKPMAARLEQADRMLLAAREHGVHLLINWPSAWSPAVHEAYRLVQEGAVGPLYELRYRAAHAGPREVGCSEQFCAWLYDPVRNGAGALMDYCCYGAKFARFFIGQPKAVTAVAGNLTKDDIAVEDNALLQMVYDDAFAVAEASWSQIGPTLGPNPVFWGREGTLAVERDRLLLMTRSQPEPREVECPPLPAGHQNGPEYLITCIQEDRPVEGMCTPEVGRDAQEILEAGLRAVNTGQLVRLPL